MKLYPQANKSLKKNACRPCVSGMNLLASSIK